MKNKKVERLLAQLEAAAGERELDLRIENTLMVNVYSGEIYPASIDVYDGVIVGINNPTREAANIIDARGQYALPGFIDTHVHIETTLLTPEELASAVVPWGSTSLFVDAMEIANVAGIEGLLALTKDADALSFRLFLEVPSRVPTAPGLETTGGILGVNEVAELLDLEESVSLGELDPSKILGRHPEYIGKILHALERGKICNGHAIGLEPQALNIYSTAHLADDHESVYYHELLDRLRVGIVPLIREGSSERNVNELIRGIIKHRLPTHNMMFCTDDKHVNDIFTEGHISYNVQRAIDLGLDPVEAIQMATINAAKHFRLDHKIGALAPGRYADIMLIRNLREIRPTQVFKGGHLVASNGKAVPCPPKSYPDKLFHTVILPDSFSPGSFVINAQGSKARCRVISLIKDQIINEEISEDLLIKDGQLHSDPEKDILKIAVVERYGKNGQVSSGFVKGFKLEVGALASSVSHDHHNIVVVGTNDNDMFEAVQELGRLQGGFAAAQDGSILGSLALPLAGLMSTLPASEVMKKMDELNNIVREMGCDMDAPFMTLSFISLPTVPELGLTDMGLIDVKNHQITELIVEIEG